MKLYICLTTYHILAACVVAVKDKNNEAELLVEGVTDEETEIVGAVRETGIFKAVYYVNQAPAWAEINKLNKASACIHILDAAKWTVQFWMNRFPHFKHIEKRYSDISIWDDHFTLGIALAYLKIPYHYFEESPGCHHRRKLFIKLSEDQITNKAFAPVCRQFGVRGDYPYMVTCNYDFSLNPMERGEKDRDFSLIRELRRMKESEPDAFGRIKHAFAPKGYWKDSKTQNQEKTRCNFLLIGQHYSDSIYKNVSTIKYVLSLLVDYFAEGMNLWMKNHPSNYFNPMQAWFPDADFIADKVPVELIMADEIISFDRVASLSSSAPLSMKNDGTDIILFQNAEDGDSFEAEKRFLDLNRYYVAARIIENIKKEYGISDLYTYGVEEFALQYLIEYQRLDVPERKIFRNIKELRNKREESGRKCFFFDRAEKGLSNDFILRTGISGWMDSLGEGDIVFFINSKGDDIFWDIDNCKMMEYIYPLPLDLIDPEGTSGLFGYGNPEYPLKNTVGKLHQETYGKYASIERQVIYMYTKDSDIIKSVLSYTIEKKLEHCGIELLYKPTALNYREFVFESMLQQVEKQYLSLQEENTQMKRRLSELS